LQARDAATGKLVWSFSPSGKVDSPPTVLLDPAHKNGIAIFGCDDGAVYALRLSDGKLAWRFTAAPTDGLAMCHGHLASAMPLPGSVLVLGDTVLVVAGHHTDLGGLHCYALDAASGAIRGRRVIGTDQPAVVANDILVADTHGTAWLGNGQSMLRFSTTLEDLPIEPTKTGAAANRPMIAFDRQGSRIRFRTDVGRGGSTHSWRGAVRTTFTAAHRIAADGEITFALRDPTTSDRHPARADQTPLIVAGIGSAKKVLWTQAVGALGSRQSYSALIKTGDRLILGGGARDGSTGFVQILNVRDGKLLATYEVPSRVTECGLCVAGRRLYACCEAGDILCFGTE
jgi:outer membrane protein assembly factor BamB